jgi:hypothetical protein
MFPGLIVLFAWFLPESPRWLYVKGRQDQAKATLARFHGNGNAESEWVKLQLWEYETHLEMNGADKRWWDYRAVFKNRASWYRLASNCIVALFGQWAGNGMTLEFFFYSRYMMESYADLFENRCRLLLPHRVP